MAIRPPWVGGFGVWIALAALATAGEERTPPTAVEISYDKQVRPIFQAQCQGCHQPAKAGGGYVMTAFDRHAQGGRVERRRRSCRASRTRAT